MTLSLKSFWLIVGFIWLIAMGFTYWNSTKIDAIGSLRKNNEQMRGELHFQHRNAKKLGQVANTHQSFFLPVASVALGLVEVKSHLHSLATVFDLGQVNIKEEMNQSTENRVPITIGAQGSIDKVLTFLTVLRKYSHLPVVQTHMKAVGESGMVEVSMLLMFQYSRSTTEQMEPNSLQVNNHHLYQGENHL